MKEKVAKIKRRTGSVKGFVCIIIYLLECNILDRKSGFKPETLRPQPVVTIVMPVPRVLVLTPHLKRTIYVFNDAT